MFGLHLPFRHTDNNLFQFMNAITVEKQLPLSNQTVMKLTCRHTAIDRESQQRKRSTHFRVNRIVENSSVVNYVVPL